MRGKVKYVDRAIWYVGNPYRPSQQERQTNTYAVLYNGDEVDIDEDEIRDYYDCSRITQSLLGQLSDDMHNVWIEYSEYDDPDDGYYLDGELSDYI